MLRLILENVRTFVDRVEIPLRPLTVLTGENSSGKTTFLAALAAVCDAERFPFSPRFNQPPYNLGSFETIATYKGGKYGRAKTFTIGYQDDSMPVPHSAEATFRSKGGQPELASFRMKVPTGNGNAVLTAEEGENPSFTSHIESDALRENPDFIQPVMQWPGGMARPSSLRDLLRTVSSREIRDIRDRAHYDLIEDLYRGVFSPPTVTSIAPIRSKPERMYGQVSDMFEPSGDHIPFLLERLVAKRPNSPETKAVVMALAKFGDESGLFKKIDVRKLGNRPDDPFQLLVTMDGRAANLIDVGYGVSQALPVVVQSVLAAQGTRVLLQQPEVHLHPRAQAGLGSFFTELVARGGRQFVVETHSDFIIDRIRQHVACGELSTEDFLLLFFERRKAETVIHQLTFDRHGNTLNAPRGYRDFFVQEELKTLGVGEEDVTVVRKIADSN
jgi:energy-coupling factor transporter ATP-binding protein EcfA2